MPIPPSDVLESFMEATKLVATKPNGPFVEFSGGVASQYQAPLLFLSYPEVGMKLESVLKRIASELDHVGCSSDYGIALAVLGILAETWDHELSSFVAHTNDCFSFIRQTQYFHCVALPNRPNPEYEIKISEFTLKAFDPDKLLYWASRGGSSYPIDLTKLKGCIALEQAPLELKLIDWDEVPGCMLMLKKWSTTEISSSIMDVYYQAVAYHHTKQIPNLVKERLLVLEGGGLVRFDIHGLLSSVMAQHIGLFRWHGKAGYRSWAMLNQLSVFHMNFYPPRLMSDCEDWLSSELGFEGLSLARPIDSTISSYCRFLQRAQSLRMAPRYIEWVML